MEHRAAATAAHIVACGAALRMGGKRAPYRVLAAALLPSRHSIAMFLFNMTNSSRKMAAPSTRLS